MKRTNQLTPAELQIMNILWDLERATVNEVLEKYSLSSIPTAGL